MKRTLKILRRLILIIISILIITALTLQISPIQTWLVGLAANKLSKDLGTKVSIKRISVGFFNSLDAEGVFIEDKQKDTLAYIGNLKCRITDWFFMKSTADLKYLGVDDAVIKLQRSDTTWNYNYIINHFASNAPKDTNNSPFNLQPKKINFKNLVFIQNDEWRGEKLTAKCLLAEIEIDSLLTAKNQFHINTVLFNKLHFDIYDFEGNRPKNYVKKLDEKPNNSKAIFEKLIKINNVKLKDCLFTLNSDKEKPWPYFDGSHIRFSQIQGNFNNTIWRGDTLKTAMFLSTKERSGFDLKKLIAKLTITPQKMEFNNLDLETNRTVLTDYYCMRYKNFDDDFADYENKVTMEGNFNKAIINTNDVAYFAPELKDWDKEFYFSGKFLGTVADFKATNLNFKERSNSTTLTGDLAMKGLPDIYKTTINFNNGTIKTNHKDLCAIVPDLKGINNPNLTALGELFFEGSFNGTLNKFVTKGNITSALGNINTDITLQLPKNKLSEYDGTLDLTDFNLGKFINEPKIGIVNFNGNIVGKSFDLKTLETNLKGNFKSLDFNGYNYTNLTTNGTFKNAYFNGQVKIDDPNVNLNSQIEIDFSEDVPKFNIFGDIVNSNLKPLKLTEEDLKITGLLDVVFSGTNIDNFLGNAKLLNANISNKNGKVVFDSLSLTSTLVDEGKMLYFNANDFSVNVVGNFKILDLPTSFQSFLHKYYPAYINEPLKVPENQKFAVTINTRFIEPYLQLLNKDIFGFNDASLSGYIDTKNSEFTAGILIPYGKYKNYSISGADIIGIGNFDTLKLSGNLTNLQISDSLSFPNSAISIVSHDDNSDFSIKTASSNNFYEADLNAKITTLVDGVKIKFNPSSFILNEKKWNLDKQGEIRITRNEVSAKEVKFTQGFQEIVIETNEEEGGNVSTLLVKLRNVVLGDITNIFTNGTNLEGIATGTIELNDFYNKFNATSSLSVEQFRIDDDSLGLIQLNANYDSKNGQLKTKIKSPNEGYNFEGEGLFNFLDTSQKAVNTTLNLKNSKIDIVQKFLGKDIFSNIKGFASGPLTIIGSGSDLHLLGKLKINKTSLKVEYTQVPYFIDSATISFEDDGINFGSFTIKDSLNNTGTVSGKLYEKDFKNMAFDFNLSTNQLLVLNTKAIHNNAFYGNVTAKANLSFVGPESNAIMTISGEPTAASHIYIPMTDSKENDEASYIVFKQIGEEMQAINKSSNFNITVDLDLIANNKVKIDVILDEVTGDVIKATGDGRLGVKVGTNTNLDMRGRYNIEEGSYDFNFQSFIRKPFYLKKGSNNFIEWSGNPYDANINISAVYEDAKQISINDLIRTAQNSINNNSRNYRGNVYVIADLKGKLSKPDIKFRLDFPANSPLKNDDVFDRFLKNLESNENEMLKQVTYLIVFNSFAPVGEGGGSQTNFTSIGVNTISSILTKQVNKSITNLLYKITGDKSITFDLATAAYNSNDLFGNGVSAQSGQFDRANVKFKIGKNFFNDNVIVSFGGDLDFNLTSAAQSGNFQWLPDLNVEVVLSTNKKLRMLIFSKNSLDISGGNLGRRNRQGIGLTYKKDFNFSPFEKDSSDLQFK